MRVEKSVCWTRYGSRRALLRKKLSPHQEANPGRGRAQLWPVCAAMARSLTPANAAAVASPVV
jgi:hypothetical protein